MMQKISQEKAIELMEATRKSGTIFTVEYVKRTNGEYRVMNCRLGVKKGVKGVGLSYDPKAKNLMGVYDMHGGFKMVALDAMVKLSINGEKFDIDQGMK